jgi:Leucine-rich repeat (LRR) protein
MFVKPQSIFFIEKIEVTEPRTHRARFKHHLSILIMSVPWYSSIYKDGRLHISDYTTEINSHTNPPPKGFLNDLPPDLRTLICEKIPLTDEDLPDQWPPQLEYLSLNYTKITILILPPSLKRCDCGGNPSLTILHAFEGLEHLTSVDSGLSPDLKIPSTVTILHMPYCKLPTLPVLPSGLKELRVNNCGLKHLSDLPPTLETLAVDHNDLTTLPPLPSTLKTIVAYRNKLTTFPSVPERTRILLIQENQLSSLPMLPMSLEILNVDDSIDSSIDRTRWTHERKGFNYWHWETHEYKKQRPVTHYWDWRTTHKELTKLD